MSTKTFDEVLNDVLAFTANQQGLAYHLGILVQVAYKHSCAQRSEKFFQAIKKLERNTRKFVRQKISTEAKIALNKSQQSSENHEPIIGKRFAQTLSSAFLILLESNNNCMECIRYSDITCMLKEWHVNLEPLPTQMQGVESPEPQKIPEKLVHVSLEKLFGTSLGVKDSTLDSTEDKNQSCNDTDLGIVVDRSQLSIKPPADDESSKLDVVYQNEGIQEMKTLSTKCLMELKPLTDISIKCKSSQIPISTIPRHQEKNGRRRNKLQGLKYKSTKLQSTPLKFKRYHYNLFQLFRHRKIKAQK